MPPAGARRPKRVIGGVLAVTLVASGAVFTAARWIMTRQELRSDAVRTISPTAQLPPRVVGLGRIEPVGSLLKLGAPGNPDGSRIASVSVADGDIVEAGQTLAVLDNVDKSAAQLASAESMLALKQAQLDRQRRDHGLGVAQRLAAVDRARADLEMAEAEASRQQTLMNRNVATAATVEKRTREVRVARATFRESEAALARANALSADTMTPVDVAVAERELAVAVGDVAVARASLDLATIRAPVSGRVLSLNARAGERIGTEGLLEMGDTRRMRAIVEVYQSDIGRVRNGQEVQLTAEALPGAVTGRVERIGAAVRRQTVINNDPATATDARVVEVSVTLDAEASRLVSGLSRLQVRGVFVR